MSNSTVNFKVYCVNGDFNEVKRFFLDAGAATSFMYIQEKLVHIFSNLRNVDYKINWKDADGDFISITNDDDLITALTEMQENPKVLYVHVNQQNTSEPLQSQFRVICNICEKGITGYRYKCIECPDYDLCTTCESSGHHSEHLVLRLPNSNTSIAKLDRKMMFNAARALKKSAFTATKEAHRCFKDSFRGVHKGKSSHQDGHQEGASSQNSTYQCPFASADLGDLISQNMGPLLETFSGATNNPQENASSVADLVRSVAEAFTGLVNSTVNPQNKEHSSSAPQSQNAKEKQTNSELVSNEVQIVNDDNAQPAEVTAPTQENQTKENTQEMEWTIVSDSDESVSQSDPKLQEQRTQPPLPPQDPRLMRGLAQLYEMGFSNENHFLNYMLENHNYNVGDVVKAILQLK